MLSRFIQILFEIMSADMLASPGCDSNGIGVYNWRVTVSKVDLKDSCFYLFKRNPVFKGFGNTIKAAVEYLTFTACSLPRSTRALGIIWNCHD